MPPWASLSFGDLRTGASGLMLGRNGRYRAVSQSRCFPFLPMPTFERFLLRLEHEDQTSVLREFRDWVRTLQR